MKFKKSDTKSKVKKTFRNFMYEEKIVEELEERDKLDSKEKCKSNTWFYIYLIVLAIFAGSVLYINNKNSLEDSELMPGADFLEEKLEGDINTINSGELTKYMIDNISGYYVKIAMTKIGDRVAYSLTYNYDRIPNGQVATEDYFTAGSMASILLNGYPNKSYEDMGLNNEEEAYLATQLAVYEFVAQMQYEDIANGEFSIDSITASEYKYVDMVERIKEKAKELLNYALENPFEEDLSARLDTSESKIKIDDNVAISGPYYVETDTDEITKKLMGDAFNPRIEVNVKSYIDNTSAIVTDEDGNELENVKNGENFYIKINGKDKVFSQFKVQAKTYALRARIYKTTENNKKYVVLEPKDIDYTDIISIIHNLNSGNIDINFKNYDGENLSGIKYYIYDENNQFIQDIDISNGVYELPVGKYYIKIYEIPDGYFINGEKFDFEVVKDKENVLDIEVDSL